jgi:hypothetical protein
MNHQKGESVQMMRKGLYMVLIVCLLAMVPASVALAQRPEPPDGLEGYTNPPLLDPSIPPPDVLEVPEAVQKAVELRESLTPQQLAAIQRMLGKYAPEMQAMGDALQVDMSVGEMAFGAPDAAEPERVDADLAAGMEALRAKMDAEMAAILDADQLALHHAALMGPARSGAAASGWDVAPAETGGYTSNCLYSPRNGYAAEYYAYYGYMYAYYAYYSCGGSNCYYAYLYAYYGWLYAGYAQDYACNGYFGAYFGAVKVTSGQTYLYWARVYSYDSYVYNYYSNVYASACYSGCGNTYSYYSYLYNYYSDYYAYPAYYYAYYCWYYW